MAGISPTAKMEWLREGTGHLIDSFTSSDIVPSQTPVSSSGDSKLICSFNWTKEKQPTILVPGGAPNWSLPELPIQLQPDSELRQQQVTQDDPLLPTYPFEPVLRAAEVMNPGITFDLVDVLIKRNTLRKLLAFCQGRAQSSFRIQLFLVGNTLIAERCEPSASMMLHGSVNSGFGHSFERAFTRPHPGCEDSSGHHRVLQYDIGSMRCAVCFEVDVAYAEPGTPVDAGLEQLHGRSPHAGAPPAGVDSLGEPDAGQVQAISRGNGTPQSQVAEMKVSRQILEYAMPQMWFGRNHYHIQGHRPNRSGLVTEVAVTKLPWELVRWEQKPDIQLALRKLDALLSQLKHVVTRTREKACVLVYDENAHPTLDLFACTSGRAALPADIVKKFWGIWIHPVC